MREKIKNKILGILIGMLVIAVTVSANENKATTNSVLFNSPPVADPGGPYAGIEGTEMIFDGSGSYDPDGDIVTYRWYIGPDETPDTDWSLDPILYYTFGDDFNDYVWVEVSDGTLTDAAKTPAFIENAIPEVDAGPDQSGDEGEKVNFDFNFVDPGFNDTHLIYFASIIGLGPGGMTPPTGNVTSWYWQDHSYAIINYRIRSGDMYVNDAHFYTPNAYKLVVTDPPLGWESKSGSDQGGKWINYSGDLMKPGENKWMQMKITPDNQMQFNTTVIFTLNGEEIARDTIMTPPKSSFNLAQSNIQFSFNYRDSGTYIASFYVIDDDGGNSSDTCTVTVSNSAPTIQPFGPFKGKPGDTFEISATATDKGSDDLTFTWDFGDGSSPITNVYYNNGESPDPDSSPLGGTAPFTITDTVEHNYTGKKVFTITALVHNSPLLTASRTVLWISCLMLYPIVFSHISLV